MRAGPSPQRMAEAGGSLGYRLRAVGRARAGSRAWLRAESRVV